MTLRRIERITSKICINNRMLKKIKTFNYFGHTTFYEGEKDLNVKGFFFQNSRNYKSNLNHL
jgi:hypothetical protein